MIEARLWNVAIPCTQQVQDILNILSITNARYPAYTEFTQKYALFIYAYALDIEEIDYGLEWVIDEEDALTVLTLYVNKDFQGICDYLNTIPERPFNVYSDTL